MATPRNNHGAIFTDLLELGAPGGLTVAVKDCLDIAGFPTRCGSAAFDQAPAASRHAAVVDALLAAGCRIVGKTTMHELAYGMTGINARFGTPVNPGWPELIPGGSSSGSAVAVAAGLVDFAVGTDTGGSVRQPAACCGVFGMKPTFGRIDRRGASPADSSLDCIGPLARSIGMLERAMVAMDPGFLPAKGLDRPPRLALLRHPDGAGADREWTGLLPAHAAAMPWVELPLLDDAFRAGMTVIARETHRAFGHLLSEPAALGDDVRARLDAAGRVTDEELARAEDVRARFTAEVDALLADCDALVTPALPMPPPGLDAARDPKAVLPLTRFLRPFNLSGHPAIVLPAVDDRGQPRGIQIVGRKFEDPQLCAIAAWLCMAEPNFQAKDHSHDSTQRVGRDGA
ncbi:amidase [Azospirillum lipoferum]|uniref:Amidase n=1 Tax=Azospirillum lipoferum (strain 4B) TaxID=862719 RepID=G7Z9V0_AZOL4|nr:amidase [Azospirillum lipoferum]CBS89165.1 putative amidase [Azospirillum lipoferum 4B]